MLIYIRQKTRKDWDYMSYCIVRDEKVDELERHNLIFLNILGVPTMSPSHHNMVSNAILFGLNTIISKLPQNQ